MEVIRWYVLARLSTVAYLLALEADGVPPREPEVCEAWFRLSDLAWVALSD